MGKREFTPEYKARIVLEALREEQTISEIASREQLSRTLNMSPPFYTLSRRNFTLTALEFDRSVAQI